MITECMNNGYFFLSLVYSKLLEIRKHVLKTQLEMENCLASGYLPSDEINMNPFYIGNWAVFKGVLC